MINVFVSALFVLISFTCFSAYTSLNAINRAVMSIPIEIFENSVLIVNIESPSEISFDQVTLKNNLESYLYNAISRYTSSKPDVNCTFTNPDDQSICMTYCQSVQVHVEATVMGMFDYDKTMYYSIGEF